LTQGAGDGEGAVRVDITSPVNIYWANNLEKDPQYRDWSPVLTNVLRPSFPGQLPRIGLNLYNGIFLLDPGWSLPKSAPEHPSAIHNALMAVWLQGHLPPTDIDVMRTMRDGVV
jgi:hypothetical protein